MKILLTIILLLATPAYASLEITSDTNNEIVISYDSSITVLAGEQLTVSCWIRGSSVAQQVFMFGVHDGGASINAGDSWYFKWDNGTAGKLEPCVSTDCSTTDATIDDGAWHSVIFTVDDVGDVGTTYLDNVAQADTFAPSPPAEVTNFSIATDLNVPTSWDMKDLAIWKGVILNATERELIASSGVKRIELQIQPSFLKMYMPFNDHPDGTDIDATGSTYRDKTGNGRDTSAPSGSGFAQGAEEELTYQ